MVRKRFNHALGLGLLLAGLISQPTTAQAQTKAPAVKEAVIIASPTATSAEAGVWYQTAKYVLQSDPELKATSDKLVKKLNPRSVESFRRSLEDAVAAEGKPLKDSHVATFQKTFNQIQSQQPKGVPELLTLINASPIGKKRNDDPAFQSLLKSLAKPVSTTAVTDKAVPAATLTNDNQKADIGDTSNEAPRESVAPVVAPSPQSSKLTSTDWTAWLPLVLSGLSLAGVIYLLLSRPKPSTTLVAAPPTSQPEPVSRRSAQKDFTWDEMKKYVDRQLDERLIPITSHPPIPVIQTEPLAVAPLPASMPLPATPRQRTQYSTEAPFNNVFLARALSEQSSTYSMFAIVSSEQQPEQATFSVTGNLASHVREHRSVLEAVCDYTNFPVGNETRIITEEPGQLRRQGQDWAVIGRARIRFEA